MLQISIRSSPIDYSVLIYAVKIANLPLVPHPPVTPIHGNEYQICHRVHAERQFAQVARFAYGIGKRGELVKRFVTVQPYSGAGGRGVHRVIDVEIGRTQHGRGIAETEFTRDV